MREVMFENRGSGDAAQCGHPNPVWTCDSRLWNEVMGGDPDRECSGGILCPSCFADRADEYFASKKEWRVAGWQLVPDLRRRQDGVSPVSESEASSTGEQLRRVEYDPQADALYIRLVADFPSSFQTEYANGVVTDHDSTGRMIGVELLNVRRLIGAPLTVSYSGTPGLIFDFVNRTVGGVPQAPPADDSIFTEPLTDKQTKRLLEMLKEPVVEVNLGQLLSSVSIDSRPLSADESTRLIATLDDFFASKITMDLSNG